MLIGTGMMPEVLSMALPWFTLLLLLGSCLASPNPSQAVLSAGNEIPQVDDPSESSLPRQTLREILFALDAMQDNYFEHWLGTWPEAIDWTAAVFGTHISSTLSALTMTSPEFVSSAVWNSSVLEQTLAYENLINRYFDQVSTFYFGENAFAVRMQAFDDMLWVVLGWLENIKFQNLHSELHYETMNETDKSGEWHGKQLQVPAAHRARIFYELASTGWDSELCGGGMTWSPFLKPYKNAITNELFISASIGMYLYYTGDPIRAPFFDSQEYGVHDPTFLAAAVRAYQWLKDSNMTGIGGLYADGFHIRGYKGINEPGTKKCDILNTMVYTYNQGVILSGLRGLWLATGYQDYLQDGHELIERVLRATGWPNVSSRRWAGLGRGGVLEDACDFNGDCSQDGQTFKGIFFHHLTEFCHTLRPGEIRLLSLFADPGESIEGKQDVYNTWHLAQCRRYRDWVAHNAQAALVTRDDEGRFGMWWGPSYPTRKLDFAATDTETGSSSSSSSPSLPPGAVDYMNHGQAGAFSESLNGLLRTVDSFSSSSYSSSSLDNIHSDESTTIPTKLGMPLSRSGFVAGQHQSGWSFKDVNDRGRGRTVETQSGGLAVLRAWYQWQTSTLLQ